MISLLGRKHRTQADEATPPEPAPIPGATRGGPSLLLLADDAAGLSARRLHTFAAAGDAGDFIRFWFPPTRRDGLIAFWALHYAPNDAALPTEAVIMVRDPVDADVVFTFSLVDMESALAFLRDEARGGLDLSRVLLYWAAPASIDTADPDAVVFTPARPPIPAAPEPAIEAPAPAEPAPLTAPEPALQHASLARGRKPQAPEGLLREVAAVLQSRRWEQRQEAFQGFGSPPGRF